MPSWRLFEQQTDAYKDEVFPAHLPKLAIEAGATLGWWKWVGRHGQVIGLDRFGASAPGTKALEELGFSTENVVKQAKLIIERAKNSSPERAEVVTAGSR